MGSEPVGLQGVLWTQGHLQVDLGIEAMALDMSNISPLGRVGFNAEGNSQQATPLVL